MRSVVAAIVMLVSFIFAAPARAVSPDPDFTRQMYAEIEARKTETLGRIVATGLYPSDEQFHNAWCESLMWWKMSHPGGEARLTMQGLIDLRELEWRCGQRMRRAPVLPTEPQTPPTTQTTALEGGATNEAVQDYMRWHPDEFRDKPTLREYILARLLWWHMFGEGGDLLHRHEAARAAGLDGNPSAAAYDAAEAAERAKAEADWRAAHPGATDPPYDPHYVPAPGEGAGATYRNADPRVWTGRGGVGSYPIPNEQLPPEQQRLIEAWENRTANGSVDPTEARNDHSGEGSVDPLDQRWRRATQPIEVGSNDAVGSGARRRAQAIGAAAGVIGGVLGVGGGGGRGPELARCRVNDHALAHFENGEIALDVVAQRLGNTVTVFADIARSPDAGTFQTAFLQNQNGQMLAPSEVGICDLYGEWRLSVSWTHTTYQDGRQNAQDRGGWTETGRLGIPGLENASGAPDGLWRRLGFSNASHGAKRVAMTFELSPDQLMHDGAVLVLHVTRPSADPVTTVPFTMILEETPAGIILAPCP